MNENSNQPIYQPAEDAATAQKPTETAEATAGAATAPSVKETTVGVITEPETEEPEKNQTSLKDILDFVHTKILTPKICHIYFQIVSVLMILLALIQLTVWGFSIPSKAVGYWENVIKPLDYVGMAILIVAIIFVITFAALIIKSLVGVIRRKNEPAISLVTTLFALWLFYTFTKRFFGAHIKLLSPLSHKVILILLIILFVFYAVIRLLMRDMPARAWSLGSGVLCFITVSLMSLLKAGNFASFDMGGMTSIPLTKLNGYQYYEFFAAQFAERSYVGSNTKEALLYLMGMDFPLNEMGDFDLLYPLLHFVPIAVANVLPFAALSIIGYLLYCAVCRNCMQFYYLQACRRVSVVMLVASCLSLISLIVLNVLYGEGSLITVSFNVFNIVFTLVSCVLLIVFTSLPWKIYNKTYEHRYATYLKSEGGRS